MTIALLSVLRARRCVLAVLYLLTSTVVLRGQSLSNNTYYIGDGQYVMDAGWALHSGYGNGTNNIYLYPSNGGADQQFRFISAGSGQGTLQSVSNPSLCLYSNNGVLALGPGCDTFTITAKGNSFTIQDSAAGGAYVQDPGTASPPFYSLLLSSKSASWSFSPVSSPSQPAPPPPGGVAVSTSSPSVVFSTGGDSGVPNWNVYSGYLHVSNLARFGGAFLGASVAVSFSGTGITWVGGQGPHSGIAYVSVDGQAVQRVDNYSLQTMFPDNVYTATNLNAGSHTLWVEATPLMNTNATGDSQDVAQFNVLGGGPITATAIAPSNGNVVRNGNWTCGQNNPEDLSGGHCWSFTYGDSMSWTFSGSMVQVFGRPDEENGTFDVYIDDNYRQSIDGTFGTVDDDALNGVMIAVVAGLSGGQHTITLVNTAAGKGIQIDEFRAYQ